MAPKKVDVQSGTDMAMFLIGFFGVIAGAIKLKFIDKYGDFSMTTNFVSCVKLYFTAYYVMHTKGNPLFGALCLAGFYVLFSLVMMRLFTTPEASSMPIVVGLLPLFAMGIIYISYGVKLIPVDDTWHNTVAQVVLIITILFDAGLLIHTQVNESGSSKLWFFDLTVKSAEIVTTICRFIDVIQKTNRPWDTEKKLHLVATGLPVLVGACHIGWIVYKAGIRPRVFSREDNTTEEGAEEGVNLQSVVVVGSGVPITLSTHEAAIEDGRDGDVAEIPDELSQTGSGMHVPIENGQVPQIMLSTDEHEATLEERGDGDVARGPVEMGSGMPLPIETCKAYRVMSSTDEAAAEDIETCMARRIVSSTDEATPEDIETCMARRIVSSTDEAAQEDNGDSDVTKGLVEIGSGMSLPSKTGEIRLITSSTSEASLEDDGDDDVAKGLVEMGSGIEISQEDPSSFGREMSGHVEMSSRAVESVRRRKKA